MCAQYKFKCNCSLVCVIYHCQTCVTLIMVYKRRLIRDTSWVSADFKRFWLVSPEKIRDDWYLPNRRHYLQFGRYETELGLNTTLTLIWKLNKIQYSNISPCITLIFRYCDAAVDSFLRLIRNKRQTIWICPKNKRRIRDRPSVKRGIFKRWD